MAEYSANAIQTVTVGQNVLFTDTPVCGNCAIMHREGSGIVTLRGLGNQCFSRFLVGFSGNIAIAAGGDPGPISVAIAIDGEPLQSANMIVTPAAAGDYFNVSAQAYINVPKGCCVTVAIENTSATLAVDVQNANLTVARTC